MGKYEEFVRGGSLPPDDQMDFYEDSHTSRASSAPDGGTYVPGSSYGVPGNIVMYEPHTPEDVELIINYLKTRQFAIVQLLREEPARAQRILDMLSGAVFALNGSMAVINREQNVYLLAPEGVAITANV